MKKFICFLICIFCFVTAQNTLNAQDQKAKLERFKIFSVTK
jgi:hypothetical protein